MIKNYLVLILMIIFAFSISKADSAEIEKFASAHSIALDGIVKGKIYSYSNYPTTIKKEIKKQMMYSIGQLNGLNGGSPDLNKLEIKILSITPNTPDAQYEVNYLAKLYVSWPKELIVPTSFNLILPRSGDRNFLQSFKEKFGSDEEASKKCLGRSAHDITAGNFWYYYRPNKSNCPLNNPLIAYVQDTILNLSLELKVSTTNTKNKYPEYDKIWEDGQLVATLIFGRNKADDHTSSDAGTASFNKTVRYLVNQFGVPAQTNLPNFSHEDLLQFRSGHLYPEVQLTFYSEHGIIDIHLFVVKDIKRVGPDFISKYNIRTQFSDFISYSGHSGLGANIRAMANMGEFMTGQYQIFLINGCDTFSYVDDSLFNAHQRVNPEFKGTKYLDLITNAMPSYFHRNHQANLAVIASLATKKYSYDEILGYFDPRQRANVTGEEDNLWPLSFYP